MAPPRSAFRGDSVVGTVTAVNVFVTLVNYLLAKYVFSGNVPPAVEGAIVLVISGLGTLLAMLWAYYSRKLYGNLPANPSSAPSAESAPTAPPPPDEPSPVPGAAS